MLCQDIPANNEQCILPKPKVNLQQECFIMLSPVLCFIGGTMYAGNRDSPCTKLYQYDFETNSYTALTCSKAGHGYDPYACASDRIYLFSDYFPEYYTIATNSWTYMTPNMYTRGESCMCEISGILYVFGGQNSGINVIKLLSA